MTADTSGKPLSRITWAGLIRNGLDYLVSEGYVDTSNRRTRRAYEALEDPEADGILDAANIVSSQMKQHGQFPTWLESVFGNLSQEIRHPALIDVLKALHQRGVTLLTTNYDDVLEKYCGLQRVGRSNQDDISKFQRGDLNGVFHIHGSYHDAHEVVLDTTDYYEVRHSDVVQDVLKTFLQYKTILFIGCGSGLEDPNFDALLRWASERHKNIAHRHCLLIRDSDSVRHQPLVRVKYGPSYEDLVVYLKRLLEGQTDTQSRAADRENPLSLLPFAKNAPFYSFALQHEPACLPDTRVGLLQEIDDWADRQDEQHIFWLNGLAGTGKSTIARTVARRYFQRERLGASFFFSRGGGDSGSAVLFVTSIAAQLANDTPLRQHICEAITQHSDIATRSLSDQWRQLVLGPLSKLDARSSPSSYILVIDALDECDDTRNIQVILNLLAEARSLKRVRLRIFMTSRPDIPIRYGIQELAEADHQDFILHNIEEKIVDEDISKFLEYNLGIIRRECHLAVDWPGVQDIRRLVQKASGLFIWAATACRFIHHGKQLARSRLCTILQGQEFDRGPEKRLNEIYLTVLKNSFPKDCTKQEQADLCDTLKEILGSIVTLLSPLSANSLTTLLHMPDHEVYQTLEHLHTILDIPEDQTCPLRLHHPSFRDFLLNEGRCEDSGFWVDEKQAHQRLAKSCIRLMSNSLKQDVCGQKAPGTLVADVESGQIEQCLPLEVRYACLYWIQHLQKSGAQLCDNDQTHQFLQVHLLHWLEALGWIGKISEGILAISSLDAQIQVSLSF